MRLDVGGADFRAQLVLQLLQAVAQLSALVAQRIEQLLLKDGLFVVVLFGINVDDGLNTGGGHVGIGAGEINVQKIGRRCVLDGQILREVGQIGGLEAVGRGDPHRLFHRPFQDGAAGHEQLLGTQKRVKHRHGQILLRNRRGYAGQDVGDADQSLAAVLRRLKAMPGISAQAGADQRQQDGQDISAAQRA